MTLNELAGRGLAVRDDAPRRRAASGHEVGEDGPRDSPEQPEWHGANQRQHH